MSLVAGCVGDLGLAQTQRLSEAVGILTWTTRSTLTHPYYFRLLCLCFTRLLLVWFLHGLTLWELQTTGARDYKCSARSEHDYYF
jgi:hypothetical protein